MLLAESMRAGRDPGESVQLGPTLWEVTQECVVAERHGLDCGKHRDISIKEISTSLYRAITHILILKDLDCVSVMQIKINLGPFKLVSFSQIKLLCGVRLPLTSYFWRFQVFKVLFGEISEFRVTKSGIRNSYAFVCVSTERM